MKALFLGLVAIGMALNTIQAQEINHLSGKRRIDFGILTGLSYSYPLLRTQFPDHSDPYIDRFVGIDMGYRLNHLSSLRIQPSWIFANSANLSRYQPALFTSSTLKLPILYRHYVLPSRKFLFVEAGLSYNQLINSSYYKPLLIECIVAPCPTFYAELHPSIKSAMSSMAGIGVTIDVQKISIPLTLRYERYLSAYAFPNEYSLGPDTRLMFENIVFTTGVNF